MNLGYSTDSVEYFAFQNKVLLYLLPEYIIQLHLPYIYRDNTNYKVEVIYSKIQVEAYIRSILRKALESENINLIKWFLTNRYFWFKQ